MSNNKHLKLTFFGSSDEGYLSNGNKEDYASDCEKNIESLINSIIKNKDLELISVYTGGYGGTMNMIAQYFHDKFNENNEGSEMLPKIETVGVVSKIYGTFEKNNELKVGHPNKISKYNHRLIWTDSLQERTSILVESSNNIIVLPGKQGTLIEFLLADEIARISNKSKKIRKRIFLHDYWNDLLLKSKYLRNSYYINSPNHIFWTDESNLCENLIYDSLDTEADDLEYSKNGEYDLTNIKDYINDKLKFLNGNHCIEGLDFAYTIQTNEKIEESKFSSISSKKYQIATEKFLANNSIIKTFINENYNSYFTYSNYNLSSLNNNLKLLVIPEKDITRSIENPKKFTDWVKYLKDNNIGSSTLFLFENFGSESKSSENSYKMYYSIFLTLNVEVSKHVVLFLKEVLKKFLFRISNSKSIQIFERKEKSLKIQTIKASLATIMARNQSHNIGSHVLSRTLTAQDLNLYNIVRDEHTEYTPQFFPIGLEEKDNPCSETLITDKEWTNSYNNKLEKVLESIKSKKSFEEIVKKFCRNDEEQSKLLKDYFAKQELANQRIAEFNDYLKSRQEFLSDVVSAEAQLFSVMDLKESLMRGISKNRILLDRISGVSDFKYTLCSEVFINGELQKDVPLAIANGIMGSHAFYVILENIIRNTAKHGSKLKNNFEGPYIFTIRVCSSSLDPSYYQITVYDNISLLRHSDGDCKCPGEEENHMIALDKNMDENTYTTYYKENSYLEGKSEPEYSKVHKGQVEINKLDKLIIDQNKMINESILKEDMTLREHALGLIEMEACAAFLRGIAIEKIEAEEFKLKFKKDERQFIKDRIKGVYSQDLNGHDYKENVNSEDRLAPRLLRAVNPISIEGLKQLNNEKDEVNKTKIKKENRLNCLGYRFYMPKPKKILVVDGSENGELLKIIFSNREDQSIKTIIQKAITKGVLICKANEIGNFEDVEKFDENNIYPHEIMLYRGIEQNKLKANLPKTQIDYTEIEEDIKEQLVNSCSGIDKKEDVIAFFEGLFRNHNWEQLNVELNRVSAIRSTKGFTFTREYHKKLLGINDNKLNELNLKEDGGHHVEIFKENNIEEICTYQEKSVFEAIRKYWNTECNDALTPKAQELQLKYLDSLLKYVVIFEERLQAFGEKKYQFDNGESMMHGEIWYGSRVFMPNKEVVDFEKTNFTTDTGKQMREFFLEIKKEGSLIISEFLSEDLERKKVDYMILHLGILEKLKKFYEVKENDNSYNYIPMLLNKIFGEENLKNTHIILTSGRIPRGLPPQFSFINLSTLTAFVQQRKIKMHLAELCKISRPKL